MSERQYTPEYALKVAKICAELLDIKNKDIRIMFGHIHPHHAASVRVLRRGKNRKLKNVLDSDTIEITLFDSGEFDVTTRLGFSLILHELLHVKHPDWSEDTITSTAIKMTDAESLSNRWNSGTV
jgi:hypothetical protein